MFLTKNGIFFSLIREVKEMVTRHVTGDQSFVHFEVNTSSEHYLINRKINSAYEFKENTILVCIEDDSDIHIIDRI